MLGLLKPIGDFLAAGPSGRDLPKGRSPIPSVTRRPRLAPSIRRFDAAGDTSLTGDWQPVYGSINQQLATTLAVMRGRARANAQNNPFMKGFLGRLRVNVIGHHGIGMQSDAILPDGSPDETARGLIESAWRAWEKKANCTVDARMGLTQFAQTALVSAATDGEVFTHLVRNFADNDFRFAVQGLPGHLVPTHSSARPIDAGNKLVLGVEENPGGRPVAYHVSERATGAALFIGGPIVRPTRRVPAEDIAHMYVSDQFGQARGVPWTDAVMKRLRQIGGYEEAAVVNARVGACKTAYIKQEQADDYLGRDTRGGEDAPAVMAGDPDDQFEGVSEELVPGTKEILPPGTDLATFDPTYPDSEFAAFMRAMLMGVAAGLPVTYTGLTGDLTGVNFSSLRQMAIEERDIWRALQSWLIDYLYDPIFDAWLPWAITAGQIPGLSIADLPRLQPRIWQPRGWDWVDPVKDQRANDEAIAMLQKTHSQVARERGQDFEQICAQRQRDRQIAKRYDIELPENLPASAPNVAPEEDEGIAS